MAKLILKLQDGASTSSKSCPEASGTEQWTKQSSEPQKVCELLPDQRDPGGRHTAEDERQQTSPLDKECWRVMPAVEVAMSAVSIAQAAAERQCEKAKAAEIEAKQKEEIALKKTSEAAEEVARARAVVLEAQQTSAAAAHLRAAEEQFAEQAAEKLSQQLSQQLAEQVEVKLAQAEVRRAELENLAEQQQLKRRQDILAAQQVAESRLKDHEQALELAVRSAERRAQNRLLDASALATSAEERAKARAKAADEEADEAIRLAQKRAMDAERACNVRIGRTQIADVEQDAATAVWANLMKDLPPGLEDKLFAAEACLQNKVGATVVGNSADALRRAREAHGKIASQTQPLAAAVMMTWGVLLAIALDTVLQLFLATQSPTDPPREQPVTGPTGDKACLSRQSERTMLSSERRFKEFQASEQPALHTRSREEDWDRLSEVAYDAEADTREIAAKQHSDLEVDKLRGRGCRESHPIKDSESVPQDLKEGPLTLHSLVDTRGVDQRLASTETRLQDVGQQKLMLD